jgi:hypothetical protein
MKKLLDERSANLEKAKAWSPRVVSKLKSTCSDVTRTTKMSCGR